MGVTARKRRKVIPRGRSADVIAVGFVCVAVASNESKLCSKSELGEAPISIMTGLAGPGPAALVMKGMFTSESRGTGVATMIETYLYKYRLAVPLLWMT